MTTEIPPASMPEYIRVLLQATEFYRSRGRFPEQAAEHVAEPAEKSARPQPAAVVQALLQAELAAKQQRVQYSFADLLGEWRLCFTTGVKKRSSFGGKTKGGIRLGRGFYLPQWTPAQIGFFAVPATAESGQGSSSITNQIQLGAVRLRFTGPAKYLGKKNLLAFDFTQMAIDCFGRTVFQTGFRSGKTKADQFEQTPIAKLPFFAFFSVTPDWIAARGRGGGLALWIREDSSSNG